MARRFGLMQPNTCLWSPRELLVLIRLSFQQERMVDSQHVDGVERTYRPCLRLLPLRVSPLPRPTLSVWVLGSPLYTLMQALETVLKPPASATLSVGARHCIREVTLYNASRSLMSGGSPFIGWYAANYATTMDAAKYSFHHLCKVAGLSCRDISI